tara:strand:- start:452 stop:796 length:345 start_codon:yes stop_codon:yes gene_type:complete
MISFKTFLVAPQADKDDWLAYRKQKRKHSTDYGNDTAGYDYQEGEGKYKGETWEQGYKRRVVKTTDPEHKEKGYNWRIKGKERNEISIKLYKEKPSFDEYKKQMKRVAGHEFGG